MQEIGHGTLICSSEPEDIAKALIPMLAFCTSDLSHDGKILWWGVFFAGISGTLASDIGHGPALALIEHCKEAVEEHAKTMAAGKH